MAQPPRIPVWLGLDHEVRYFLTLCVEGRRRVLANRPVYESIRMAFLSADRWSLTLCVVMPDHLHAIVAPRDRDEPISRLSCWVKRRTRPDDATWRWQRGCFDHLLRSEESLFEKWLYIRENPVRAGLVERWGDWPYRIDPQG